MERKSSHLSKHSEINFTPINRDDHLIALFFWIEWALRDFYYLSVPYLYEG